MASNQGPIQMLAATWDLEQAKVQKEQMEREGKDTQGLLNVIHFLREKKSALENDFLARHYVVQGHYEEL